MIVSSSRFIPDAARVAAETVDDEAIVVDLTTGVYYTMDAVGALIWSMLQQQQSVEQMVEAIVQQYVVSTEKAQDDVQHVLDMLLQHRLIAPVEGDPPLLSNENTGGKLPYTAPEVRTYGDLSDLLAMDLPVPALSPWREPNQLRG